jgi:hypothetical protein
VDVEVEDGPAGGFADVDADVEAVGAVAAKRRRDGRGPRWTIDAYETDGGEAPGWSFIRQLEGRAGRMRNLGVKTLVKCARAWGASVSIRMDPLQRSPSAAGSRVRRAG